MKNKKGFTLVELLAVIAILAILVIIAIPNVLKLFNESKKNIFLTETKTVYREALKKYTSEALKGNEIKNISSTSENKLNINGENLDYCLTLNSKGKVISMKVSNGNYYIEYNGSKIEDLNIEDVKEGTIDTTTCKVNREIPVNNCTFNEELVQGAEYTNGQYIYRYKQQGTTNSWENINEDGWGVILTDKDSTDEVTTPLCTSINDKPIVSMKYMFYGSKATTLDLSSFNTSNVTNMKFMFYQSKANTLDVSSFDTSNVTNMSYMFDSSKATTIVGLGNFDTSKVTDMSSMFASSQATTLDVSSFDTSNVTDMSDMFYYSQATTLDVSGFNTSNVTDMSYMFTNIKATTLDVSSFDTSNVTNMSHMFASSQATTLDLSRFDTSKVTNMGAMFGDSKATTLDLSSFDTSKVTDMYRMFDSSQTTTIYVSNKWNTSNVIGVTKSNYMFRSTTNLVGGAGTRYSSSNPIDKTYARVDGGTSNPGYFTLKTN